MADTLRRLPEVLRGAKARLFVFHVPKNLEF